MERMQYKPVLQSAIYTTHHSGTLNLQSTPLTIPTPRKLRFTPLTISEGADVLDGRRGQHGTYGLRRAHRERHSCKDKDGI